MYKVRTRVQDHGGVLTDRHLSGLKNSDHHFMFFPGFPKSFQLKDSWILFYIVWTCTTTAFVQDFSQVWINDGFVDISVILDWFQDLPYLSPTDLGCNSESVSKRNEL